jgi:predicted nuclease with TOPRIM domain
MITIEIYQRIIELQRIENVIEQKEEIYKLLTGKDPESMTLEKFLKEYRKEIAKLEIPLEPLPLVHSFKGNDRTFTPLMEYAKWQTWRFISYWEVCKKEPENIALQMAIMTEEKKGEKLDSSERF